jgi:drug/metabolite transporter (DMT)-like permease
VGQKYAKPTAASIILSTEAIFGVMGGFLLLGERLTAREALGCVLMFAAVILAQLPLQGRSAKKKSKKI